MCIEIQVWCFWMIQIQPQKGIYVSTVYPVNNHKDLFGLIASLYLEVASFCLHEVICTVQYVS